MLDGTIGLRSNGNGERSQVTTVPSSQVSFSSISRAVAASISAWSRLADVTSPILPHVRRVDYAGVGNGADGSPKDAWPRLTGLSGWTTTLAGWPSQVNDTMAAPDPLLIRPSASTRQLRAGLTTPGVGSG